MKTPIAEKRNIMKKEILTSIILIMSFSTNAEQKTVTEVFKSSIASSISNQYQQFKYSFGMTDTLKGKCSREESIS